MKKMNPVVHFEMPYEDKDRMTKFYSETFGWKAQIMAADMGNYVVVSTTEIDEKTQFPKEPGRINGGFFEKKAGKSAGTLLTIAVDDMQEAMDAVKKAGGTVDGEPVDIPGVGKYVAMNDTEGNRMSLLQPDPKMKVRPQ